MRDLVERADTILMLDGCGMACGTRLLKGALPDRRPTVVFTNRMFECDTSLFSVNEMPDAEIRQHAGTVAGRVVARSSSRRLVSGLNARRHNRAGRTLHLTARAPGGKMRKSI